MNRLDITQLLTHVSKPTRYLGNESNSIHKNLDKVSLKVALAFPDVYEIGMSHLGLKILYQIINDIEDVVAERVYAPWLDAEEIMRKHHLPLFSLESRLPIKEFDILGFSLQYELSYTNILNMLDLSQIPLLASSRNIQFPLVIAGGPLSFNPEPLADFIDVFCIGDGEELILELIEIYKQNRHKPKSEILLKLSQIQGVYVPSLYQVSYYKDGRIKEISPEKPKIKKRIINNLNNAPFPTEQIVPFMNIIHDRASLEVQRGCTQGCRFCHAGMVYRPVRERSISCLLNQANEVISKTGYEELSLGSLSTTEYSYILNLISNLRSQFGNCVNLSLPSLRINPLMPEISSILAQTKPTGLTLVPEVGTAKMQKVINKQVEIDKLTTSIENIFYSGWKSVKLYFMIGLPQENYEDLDGIIDIIYKLKRLCKGRHTLKISLSSFVPKAHTPFQWVAQLSKEELITRQHYIRDRLPKKGIEFSWHDTNLSFLEAVFAKGDRKLGQVLFKAYELGCKFDSWDEYFDFDKWQKAFYTTKIDPAFYANRLRELDEIFPWEHIDSGITKDFLWDEYQKALHGIETPDCKQTKKCNQCGLEKECCYQKTEDKRQKTDTFRYSVFDIRCSEENRIPNTEQNRKQKTENRNPKTEIRVRIKFNKEGDMKYISHLDLLRLLMRAIRRANIPIVMTAGYSPHPKISFSHALAVGISSQAEYADLDLFEVPKLEEMILTLNKVLPEGIKVSQAGFVANKPALTALINRLLYNIKLKEIIPSKIEDFLSREEIWIFRESGKINIRAYIDHITLNKQELMVLFKIDNGKTVKLPEFLEAISVDKEKVIDIVRIGQFYKDNTGNLVSPLAEWGQTLKAERIILSTFL